MNSKKTFSLIIILIFSLIYSSCSNRTYTLFQKKIPEKANFFTLKNESSSCSENVAVSSNAPTKQIKKHVVYEYKIASGDRISITIFNHPELSTFNTSVTSSSKTSSAGIVVSATGTVNLPLVGAIKLSGLTCKEASKLLIEKFKKYIKRPYVSVEVVNKRIYVIGEVKTPGVIPVYSDSMSLIEALAESGGMNEFALRTNIMILRGDLHNPDIKYIDLTDLNKIKISDLILKPNDIVYVPPNKMRGRNIGIKSIMPPIDLIQKLLSTFVSVKYLSR